MNTKRNCKTGQQDEGVWSSKILNRLVNEDLIEKGRLELLLHGTEGMSHVDIRRKITMRRETVDEEDPV